MIVRRWCFLAISLHLAVLLAVLAILIGRDSLHQAQHSWWENSIGPVVVVAQLSALSMFAWRVRLAAWLILFAGLFPLVTFSMYLAPLLMTTVPALWPWHRVAMRLES